MYRKSRKTTYAAGRYCGIPSAFESECMDPYQDSKLFRCRFLAVRTYHLHVYPIQNSSSQRALTVRVAVRNVPTRAKTEGGREEGGCGTIRLPAGLFRQWGGGGGTF